MTATEPRPLRLALLASAQTMPNLESVVALAAHQPLATAHVYWTDYDDSRRAAGSLERVLRTIAGRRPFRGFNIERDERPGSGQLEDVVAWLRARLDRFPDARWVLNATGGTKPMAAGFLVMADHAGVESVIYRELSARSWLALRPASGDVGRYVTEAPPSDYGLERAGRLLDEIPLVNLLRAQLGFEDLRVDRKPEAPLDAARLDPWITELDPNDERPFAAAARRAGLADLEGEGEGPLFERLIHGVLASFGHGGLARSVEVRPNVPGETPPAVNEIDLFVRHGGRICALDLKLSAPDDPKVSLPTYDQIRTAAKATETLAGIDARVLMLRPNWPPKPDVSDYARKVHRVRVVDATEMPRVFEIIAEELSLEGALPESAQRLQRFFDQRLARGLPSAGETPIGPRIMKDSSIIDLAASLRQSHAMRQSHWALATAGSDMLLSLDFCTLPFDPEGTDLAERLRALKSDCESFKVRTLVLSDKAGLLAIRSLSRKAWQRETTHWTPRFRDCRQALSELVHESGASRPQQRGSGGAGARPLGPARAWRRGRPKPSADQ